MLITISPMQTFAPLEGSIRRQKRLTPALSACTVLITLAAGLTACGSDDMASSESDSGGQPSEQFVAADGSSSPLLDDRAEPLCVISPNDKARKASWADVDKMPYSAVVLTQQIDLPPQFDSLKNQDWEFVPEAPFKVQEGLVQYQDRTIGVVKATPELTHWFQYASPGTTLNIATVNSDGQLESQSTYIPEQVYEVPKAHDLANDQIVGGYYRIQANEGIEIPTEAMGIEDEQNFALSILPDVDKETLWVLLRGSSDLYKAEFYRFQATEEPIELNHANCVKL